jgi:hypothetical protein
MFNSRTDSMNILLLAKSAVDLQYVWFEEKPILSQYPWNINNALASDK